MLSRLNTIQSQMNEIKSRRWMRLNQDDEWYYVNKEEFKNLKEVLIEFHKFYSDKSH